MNKNIMVFWSFVMTLNLKMFGGKIQYPNRVSSKETGYLPIVRLRFKIYMQQRNLENVEQTT